MANMKTNGKRIGLLGAGVKIRIPHHYGGYDEEGEVTGLGLPLVQVQAGGDVHYRHIDDLTLKRSIVENTAGLS